jgi:lactoylglutathione lyase
MATKKKSKRPTARAARAKKPARATRKTRKKPETFRARAASPSLTVNDLARSLAWYRDILGFTVKDTWKEGERVIGYEVVAGKTSIMLGQDDFAQGRDRRKGVGMRFYLATVQNVDDLAGRIKAKGGVLDHEPKDMPWGSRLFTVTDPDGFRYSIFQGS